MSGPQEIKLIVRINARRGTKYCHSTRELSNSIEDAIRLGNHPSIEDFTMEIELRSGLRLPIHVQRGK